MKVKLNTSELNISDVDDGKIILNINTLEGYFIEENIYKKLLKAESTFVDINDLGFEQYSTEEINDFIKTLIDNELLIKSN